MSAEPLGFGETPRCSHDRPTGPTHRDESDPGNPHRRIESEQDERERASERQRDEHPQEPDPGHVPILPLGRRSRRGRFAFTVAVGSALLRFGAPRSP